MPVMELKTYHCWIKGKKGPPTAIDAQRADAAAKKLVEDLKPPKVGDAIKTYVVEVTKPGGETVEVSVSDAARREVLTIR